METDRSGRGRRLAAGAIAGIAIAGFVVFLAFLLCCYCCCFRKKRAARKPVHYGGPPTGQYGGGGGGGMMQRINGMMGRGHRGPAPDYGVQPPPQAVYR